MTNMTILFAALFYIAGILLLGGLAWRIADYWRTPVPLKIPTTPAPKTSGGVVLRMMREVLLFESLFKSNLWIWIFGALFHFSLALVLMRHLRYFTEPVWSWVALIQPFGMYAGFAMAAGLAGLWARRILVERIRYISTPSDHLMLVLLLAIGLSGLSLRFLDHPDIVATKAFILGLLRLDLQPLPESNLLYVHLGLVAALAIIFPFSKLLHAPGVFFSPTRNQVDNARTARHLAPWARRLETGS